MGKEKDFEIYELKNEIEKIKKKCGKTEKDESDDSNEYDSGYDDKTGNGSESVFDGQKIKQKKNFEIKFARYHRKKKKEKKE